MVSTGIKLFHLSQLALYLYVNYFLQIKDDRPPPNPETKFMLGFSKCYLTNWTFGVQTIYLILCVLSYIARMVSNKAGDKITSAADYLFTSIATPMAFGVTAVFWILYGIDRELVFPKALDLMIPVWVNHTIHTFNSAFAIVDILLINHKFPSWKSGLKGSLIYMLAYCVCLYGTYFRYGVWLYPVLKEMNWPIRIVFTLSYLLIAVLMIATTRLVHQMSWGSATPEKSKKSGKHKKK